MRFGAHHEWGKLREVVIGISPAEDFVVFHEESQRWLLPEGDRLSRAHKGRRLIDVDPERAKQRREQGVAGAVEITARQHHRIRFQLTEQQRRMERRLE